MATRNERRARAKAANAARSERIANAARAYDIALKVKANLSAPKERNYYPNSSCVADLKAKSHRVYVCRASGGMERGRAMALKAQGKY